MTGVQTCALPISSCAGGEINPPQADCPLSSVLCLRISMRRFLVAPGQISDNRAFLAADEARHALQILRLGPGERVELLDGNGAIYEAIFDSLTKSRGELTVIARRQEVEPIGRLTIAQAQLKGKKMELLVQKATELGIDALQPITTARSAPPGKEDRDERLRKISLQACKQCGRSRPVTLLPLTPLAVFLKQQQAVGVPFIIFFR